MSTDPIPDWVHQFVETDWADPVLDAHVAATFGAPDRPLHPEQLRWHRRTRWIRARRQWLDRYFQTHPEIINAHVTRLIQACRTPPCDGQW